jgi:hypothetical protein
MALVCAMAGLTMAAGMVAGWFVVNAGYEAIYNCNPDPYVPPRCQAPRIAYLSAQFGPWLVLFGPLLVATYLLARREAIVRSVGSGYTYGWFACVFMGLMWWLGLSAIVVLWFYEAESETISEFLGSTVVVGAIAVPLIGVATAVVGSAMQWFIGRRRRKRLPQAA